MRESRRGMPVLEAGLDEELVERVVAATEDALPGERILAGLEAAIDLAEADPEGVRAALWELRSDPVALARLEGLLGGTPESASLRLGAAIQLAGAELASEAPDLRSRTTELLRWLEGDW